MGSMLRTLIALVALTAVAACTAAPTETGSNGAKLYRISAAQESKIQFRMLDSVNALRQASGLSPLVLNAALNAAAATHSRDMAVQNRPWHFGSDGSSPIQRVQRAGYIKTLLGENISETYETETETLSAWMGQPDTRAAIMDERGQDLGFAWYQEPGGKIWWTLIVGGSGANNIQVASPIAARPQG